MNTRSKETPLLPERGGGGGLSLETYLSQYQGKKCVVRKCSTLSKAKSYEAISKRLSTYQILPRLLGREGKHVYFEYLKGRDLRQQEKINLFYEIGKICGIINTLSYNQQKSMTSNFHHQIQELVSGTYQGTEKIKVRKERDRRPQERFHKARIKALLTAKQGKAIIALNNHLLKTTKAKLVYDANDVVCSNFRLSKNKVYLVDIEGIKPKIKGFGIGKCFLKWAKDEKRRKVFLKGYQKHQDITFLTEDYMALLYLNFLMQTIHYKAQIGRDYQADFWRLKTLLEHQGIIL